MAIKAKNIKAQDKDGNAVDLAGSNASFANNHAFTLIPQSWYTAIITKVEESTFRMSVSGFENPNSEDGKWAHLRLTPKFKLLNDNATIISRQNFIVGAVENNELIAPNPDNDVVWGGVRGARDLLQALKMFTEDGEGGFNMTFHAPAVRNMVVRVMTSIGGYRKGEFDITPQNMLALLNEHSDEALDFSEARFDREAVEKALAALNEANGYSEDDGYKLKNVIIKIQPLWEKRALEDGLFIGYREVGEDKERVSTGQVFVDEEAFEAYVNAMYDADLENDF